MGRELSDEDVERRLLEKEQKPGNILSPITYWRCKEKNGCTARFCHRCSAELDEEKLRREMITLIKEANNVNLVKSEQMIDLGKQLIETGKQLAKERVSEDGQK